MPLQEQIGSSSADKQLAEKADCVASARARVANAKCASLPPWAVHMSGNVQDHSDDCHRPFRSKRSKSHGGGDGVGRCLDWR